MFEARVRKEGNYTIVTVPAEVLAALEVSEGDTIYFIVNDDGGLKVTSKNPILSEALTGAQIIMEENQEMLQSLT